MLDVGSFADSGSDALQSGSSCCFLNCGSAKPYVGVITNLGSVEASGGIGYPAILLQGTFGTLVNNGTIKTTSGDITIKINGSADSTLIVQTSTGVLDLRVSPQGADELAVTGAAN